MEEKLRRKNVAIFTLSLICIALACLCVWMYLSVVSGQSPVVEQPPVKTTPQPTPEQSYSPLEKYEKKLFPVIPPDSGTILRAPALDCVAPLTIVTTGSNDYFIKLVSVSDKSKEFWVYVRGGTTVDIDMPLGVYELRYCTGQTWYGTSDKFGPDTTYCKADSLFPFTETDGYYNGWTVELFVQPDGNLDIEDIDASEF